MLRLMDIWHHPLLSLIYMYLHCCLPSTIVTLYVLLECMSTQKDVHVCVCVFLVVLVHMSICLFPLSHYSARHYVYLAVNREWQIDS